jgi:hypothetical protein
MSGIIGSKINIKGSGRIAKLGTDGQVFTSAGAGVAANYEDVAGGISWQAVETGSTMTAVAGEGYPINTTSNACTITLPASASNGDQIIFTDYARTWGTNGIVIDSNGLNYQGDDDTFDVEYGTDGQSVEIVYSGATNGWIPTLDKTVEDEPSKGNQNGIFGYGETPLTAITNIVSNAGVVATDTAGVGTARLALAATEYGGDKGIFGFGNTAGPTVRLATTNLVTNAGVVGADVTGVGTGRRNVAACSYGGDKGIFGYGNNPSNADSSLTNLVSNTGVAATDTVGVGTARQLVASCEYGGDKGIFGYGLDGGVSVSMTNLISNTGVAATDTTGVGTARGYLAACGYGYDKGIFGYGYVGGDISITNLVSNAGVVATDTVGVGTARRSLAATQYGGDKGIFGYGEAPLSAVTNLVSNTGVVATDTTGVGTTRASLAACSYN